MPVGNVDSKERGSGARFNDDKVNLTLLPPWCWEEVAMRNDPQGINEMFFGRELSLLVEFWEGNDEALEDVIDGLTDEDFTEAAQVFAYGAKKYSEWNWAKGMKWSVPMACYLRHMLLADPVESDEESGISHRGHAVCNLIMLAHFLHLCGDMDDRPVEIRPEWHEKSTELTYEEVLDLEKQLSDRDAQDRENWLASLLKDEDRDLELTDTWPYFVMVSHDPDDPPDKDEVHAMLDRLTNLPTPELNDAVERLVEEQEFRERVLRSTGQLV